MILLFIENFPFNSLPKKDVLKFSNTVTTTKTTKGNFQTQNRCKVWVINVQCPIRRKQKRLERKCNLPLVSSKSHTHTYANKIRHIKNTNTLTHTHSLTSLKITVLNKFVTFENTKKQKHP